MLNLRESIPNYNKHEEYFSIGNEALQLHLSSGHLLVDLGQHSRHTMYMFRVRLGISGHLLNIYSTHPASDAGRNWRDM